VATKTPTWSPTPIPARSPAPLFGVFLILWLAFMAALIVDPGALDSVWQWLIGLPLVLQVVLRVLFLPLTVGLWIWESDLALWLRLLLIIAIALVNLSVMAPKPTPQQSNGE
jgi:hypothetical protein